MTDLAEFWHKQHIGNTAWLTGTSWDRIQEFYDVSDRDFQDRVCLEIGVGRGTVTKALAALASELHCCDVTQAALDKVQHLATQCWLSQDIDHIPPVDIALCHLVLVHCTDEECVRILKSISLKDQARVLCQFSSFKDPAMGARGASVHTLQTLDLDNKHFFRDLDHIGDIVRSADLKIHKVKQHDPGSFQGWQGQFWQFLDLRR